MAEPRVPGTRPQTVWVHAVLLVLSAVFMASLGWSASAYYVPAASLAILALLLVSGRAFGVFRWSLVANQASGVALVLVLWLGDGFGETKLDLAGVMLLLNLLCGGPLLAIWALSLLPALRRGGRLFEWFHPRSPWRSRA